MAEPCRRHGVLAEFTRARPCAEDPDTLTVEGLLTLPAAAVADRFRAASCVVAGLSDGTYIVRSAGEFLLMLAASGQLTATRIRDLSAFRSAVEQAVVDACRRQDQSVPLIEGADCHGYHVVLRS